MKANLQRTMLVLVLGAAAPARAAVEPLSDWMQRVRLGGAAAARFMDGEARSQLERNSGFMLYQAKLTLDADVRQGVSFLYDLNVLREGTQRASTAGSPPFQLNQVYLRWDNVFHRPWLNAKIGKAFMPFGEEYLRWDAIENPLASWSAGFHWRLDEGVVFFGDVLEGGKLSYSAGVQNGNNRFNFDDNNHKSYAARLTSEPLSWVHASASYMYLGRQGDNVTASTATADWWLSGHLITPMGTTSAPGGSSPSRILNGQAGELNTEFKFAPGRAKLTYGYVSISDGGGDRYDRIIRYYAGELVGDVPMTAKKVYAAGRYSAIGTFHGTRGYRFSGTEIASSGLANNSQPYPFNYNQRDLYRWSLGTGYRFDDRAVLKVEWTWEGTHLIDPAKTPANLAQLKKRNYFVTELAVRF